MYTDKDIIVAPATLQNVRAPLAILRVSGEGCFEILNQFFDSKSGLEPWQLRYGYWRDQDGVVDDVTVVAFQSPKSYTGQDMFEVTCHGNPVFVSLIEQSMIKSGARRAKPGEFTTRAVLNGKMDLLQAESVNELIEANTRYQADLARRQSKGPLVAYIKDQVESILQVQAHIEATIDYGEEDIDALERETLQQKVKSVISGLTKVHQTASFTRSMRRGFRVLITGEPNVGKSTLFNALVKHERAIVTHLPGTTRDLISEEIEVRGLPIVLIDSAGVRDTDDVIEQMGIGKIYEMLENVDLVLHLSTLGETSTPYEKIATLPKEKWITIRTKADLNDDSDDSGLKLSAVTGEGLDLLEQEIVTRLSKVMEGQTVYLINQRQEETVAAVIACLTQACEDFETGFGEEVLSSYLNTARHLLGELTGETSVEDILDRMFSNFCLGK